MSTNVTAVMLEANLNPVVLQFSKQVTTSSTFLAGAGGIGADGFPVPFSGHITGLQVWDGATIHSATGTREISTGDRLSVFASYSGGTFNVAVIHNGNFTTLQVNGLPASSTYMASVPLLLARS